MRFQPLFLGMLLASLSVGLAQEKDAPPLTLTITSTNDLMLGDRKLTEEEFLQKAAQTNDVHFRVHSDAAMGRLRKLLEQLQDGKDKQLPQRIRISQLLEGAVPPKWKEPRPSDNSPLQPPSVGASPPASPPADISPLHPPSVGDSPLQPPSVGDSPLQPPSVGAPSRNLSQPALPRAPMVHAVYPWKHAGNSRQQIEGHIQSFFRQNPAKDINIQFNPDGKTLILRGPAKAVQALGDFLGKHNQPPQQIIKVIALQHADAETLMETVMQLFETDGVAASVDKVTNSLILRGSQKTLEEIETLALQIEQAAQQKSRPGKRLHSPPSPPGASYRPVAPADAPPHLDLLRKEYTQAVKQAHPAQLRREYEQANSQAIELAARMQQTGRKKEELDRLQQLVSKAFELRRKAQEQELRKLQTEIAQVQERLQRRSAARDQIVRRRIEQLLNEAANTGARQPLAPPKKEANAKTSQILFSSPKGMRICWDEKAADGFDSKPLTAPARYNFPSPGIHRLQISDLPGREGVELYPTLELAPRTPQIAAYLAHNAVPIPFTAEDFDQALAGRMVTKVIHLPDPQFQNSSLANLETLVSTRLEPGVDPIQEADRRGAIIAIVRLGDKKPAKE